MSEENELPEVPAVEEVKEEAAPVVEEVKELGIKETQEFIDALEIIAKAGVKSLSDGRLRGNDVFVFLDMFKDADVLTAGFKGLDKMVQELKQLEKDEIVVLFLDLVDTIDRVIKEKK